VLATGFDRVEHLHMDGAYVQETKVDIPGGRSGTSDVDGKLVVWAKIAS
jgi:hypothetical protein